MELVKAPSAGDDCRELWKSVAECAKIINALADVKINLSQVRNKLTLTSGSAILELMLGQGGAASAPKPWQPVLSPFVGTGMPPANQALRVLVTMARVKGLVAENWSDELVCFGGSIDPASPTHTSLYAEMVCTTTYKGDGSVESFSLQSWQYKRVQGLDVPPVAASPAGVVPTTFRVPFATVSVVKGAIVKIQPGLFADAQLNVIQAGGACEQAIFDIAFTTGGS